MKTWFKNLKNRRGLELEAELKASRPTPSSHLVKSIAARINPRPANPVRTRSRIAVAGIATAVMVAAVGASGGFGSAASSIAGAAKSVAQSTHATNPPGPVPGAPGPGHTVRGAGGAPSAAAQYAVAPTITGFSPMQGAPGSLVNVAGTFFAGSSAITEVDLHGEATSFFVNSSTSLTFTVPSDGSSGVVTVFNAAAPSGVDSTDSFTVLTAPTNLVANPNEGGAGTPVEIDADSGLLGATSVKFGTKAATFHVVSDTEIDTSVPVGAKTGAGLITVNTPAGSGTAAFTVDANAPTVSKFSPATGTAATTPGGTDGTLVTVTGTNLTGASEVDFNGTAQTTITNNTATSLQAKVPFGATTGPITVQTGVGQGTSKASFIVVSKPVITSFSPAFGVAGKTMVTIKGSSFTGTTEVDFNGVAVVKPTIKGDTQITAKVPAGATTGPITVTNGVDTSDPSADFVVEVAPSISGPAIPATGGAGTEVEIDGSHFTGTKSVTFNGKPGSFTVNPAGTVIDATVPAGAPAGTGTGAKAGIVVTNDVGSAQTGFNVLSTAPTITKVAVNGPTSFMTGAREGDSVIITGTNLGELSTTVSFGGGPDSTITAQSATSLTVTIHAGSATGSVTVSNADGSAHSKTSFTIFKQPVVIAFSPAYVKSPGTKVTIFGDNLAGANQILFNGTAAKATVNKDGSVSAVVPKNVTDGTIEVDIVNAKAGWTLSGNSDPNGITVVTKPSPAAGSDTTVAHGGTLHLVGTGFKGVQNVKLGKTSLAFHVTDDGHMTVTIPSNAKIGPNASIVIGNNAGTGTWKFTIT